MHALIDADPRSNDLAIAADADISAQIVVRGRGNRLSVGDGCGVSAFVAAGVPRALAEGPAVNILGDDNVIEIGSGAQLTMNLVILGNGNRITIGRDCRLNGFATIRCSGAELRVGDRTTIVNGSLQLHEPGELIIGRDCMIANQVYVSLSDIHPIHDRSTGERINPAASVHIGDHVWLGLRSMVMKGCRIGQGAVVAAGAVVSGEVVAHSVVAGVPARIVRENVEWHRDIAPTDTV